MKETATRTTEGNGPQPFDLRVRTREFALRIIRLYSALSKTTEAQVIGKQLLRSGTAVGANYHEGHRSRSDAEFVSKLGLALQELEETTYWMELLIDAQIVPSDRMVAIAKEASELTAILTASVKTVKQRREKGC